MSKKIILVLLIIIVIHTPTYMLYSSQQKIIQKEGIGYVRELYDEKGQFTGYFVPVVTEQAAKEHILEQQVLRRGKMKQKLYLLKTESDPDVRRHRLFELSNAYGEEASYVLKELLQMVDKESDENVRIEYLSCFTTLAVNGGLTDTEILQIIRKVKNFMLKDPSPNVRVHACSILSWYGEKEGENVLKEIIQQKIEIKDKFWDCIPATLQRINSQTSKNLLLELKQSPPNDSVKADVYWRLYHMKILTKQEMLNTIEKVATESPDEVARTRAVYFMSAMAKENPEIIPKLKAISEKEKGYLKNLTIHILNNLEKK
ncbi:MAG: HEAT repeat domain-containing protein [Endomicrobia bacterium]|nr:HEAT repeat domain-containing protein [Endomicrobiia bacterium]